MLMPPKSVTAAQTCALTHIVRVPHCFQDKEQTPYHGMMAPDGP